MEAWLEAALRLAAPLLLAALGELVCERAGLIHIGVEGAILCGAFAGFAVAVATGSAGLGVAASCAVGAAIGAGFAALAVLRRADAIVVGTAVNLFAIGGTGLLARALYAGLPPRAPVFEPLAIPLLSTLPLAGALFRQDFFVYLGIGSALAIGVFLARTRAGLRLRACGESARAAAVEGLPVAAIRIATASFGSALAGVAGASLSLAQADTFSEGMSAGRGFIALAIVIFGRWSALGVSVASLFFGATSALQFRLQAQGVAIPYPVFLMLPYLLTLAALALFGRGASAPADLGRGSSTSAR
jgi:simple sugar transport system permease protein